MGPDRSHGKGTKMRPVSPVPSKKATRLVCLVFPALYIVLVSLLAITVNAQTTSIRVVTNNPAANVFADSMWLGTASAGVFEVPVSVRLISLVPAAADTWSIPAIKRRLDPEGSDSLTLEMLFPYYYNLESIPSGADVYFLGEDGEELLGSTPLTYSTDSLLDGTLVFTRPGYLDRNVEAGDRLWNRHLVSLPKTGKKDGNPDVSFGIRTTRRKWIDYAAIGTAVTAGVLAIHFKTRANRKFDRYSESGDPALKSDIDRLDLYSGMALGTMQVGLGVFVFRLVF